MAWNPAPLNATAAPWRPGGGAATGGGGGGAGQAGWNGPGPAPQQGGGYGHHQGAWAPAASMAAGNGLHHGHQQPFHPMQGHAHPQHPQHHQQRHHHHGQHHQQRPRQQHQHHNNNHGQHSGFPPHSQGPYPPHYQHKQHQQHHYVHQTQPQNRAFRRSRGRNGQHGPPGAYNADHRPPRGHQQYQGKAKGHGNNGGTRGATQASGWAQVQEGDMDRAQGEVEALVAKGVTPNEVTTFNMLAYGWVQKGDMGRAQAVVDAMVAKGVRPNRVTFNTLVDGWVKRGDMARAEGVVDAMVRRGVKPNKVTFNTLADGWVKTGDMDRAQGVVDAMVAKGLTPDAVTFNTLMDGWLKKGAMDRAQLVVDAMVEKGVAPDLVTYETLIFGNMKLRNIEAALGVFGSLRNAGITPVTRTFNYFIFYYSQRAFASRKALEWFERMLDSGAAPNDHTWTSFHKRHHAYLEKARASYARRKAAGWRPRSRSSRSQKKGGASGNNRGANNRRGHSRSSSSGSCERNSSTGSNGGGSSGHGANAHGGVGGDSSKPLAVDTDRPSNVPLDEEVQKQNAGPTPSAHGNAIAAVEPSESNGTYPRNLYRNFFKVVQTAGDGSAEDPGNVLSNGASVYGAGAPDSGIEVKGNLASRHDAANRPRYSDNLLPEGYVCKICGIPGHHIRNCPSKISNNHSGRRKANNHDSHSGVAAGDVGAVWKACSAHFGMRKCRDGGACRNPTCGFAHPEQWPHHRQPAVFAGDAAPAAPLSLGPGRGAVSTLNDIKAATDSGSAESLQEDANRQVWIPGYQFGMRRCRDGIHCQRVFCGFAHPEGWQDFRNSGGSGGGGAGVGAGSSSSLADADGRRELQSSAGAGSDLSAQQPTALGHQHFQANAASAGRSAGHAGQVQAGPPTDALAGHEPDPRPSNRGVSFPASGGHLRQPNAEQQLPVAQRGSHPHGGDPEEYYRRAVALAEETAPGSVTLANALTSLGRCLHNKGNFASALAEHTRALEIRRANRPAGASAQPVGVATLSHTGSSSLDGAAEAAAAAEQWSAAVASSLNMVANALQGLGRLEEALAHHQQALEVTRGAPPSSLSVAHTLNQMGDVYEALGDRDEAIRHHRRALAVREARDYGGRRLGMVKTLQRLSALLEARGDTQEAAEFAARAISVQEGRRQGQSAQVPGHQRRLPRAQQLTQQPHQNLSFAGALTLDGGRLDAASEPKAVGFAASDESEVRRLIKRVKQHNDAWVGWVQAASGGALYDHQAQTDPAKYDFELLQRFVADLDGADTTTSRWFRLACRLLSGRSPRHSGAGSFAGAGVSGHAGPSAQPSLLSEMGVLTKKGYVAADGAESLLQLPAPSSPPSNAQSAPIGACGPLLHQFLEQPRPAGLVTAPYFSQFSAEHAGGVQGPGLAAGTAGGNTDLGMGLDSGMDIGLGMGMGMGLGLGIGMGMNMGIGSELGGLGLPPSATVGGSGDAAEGPSLKWDGSSTDAHPAAPGGVVGGVGSYGFGSAQWMGSVLRNQHLGSTTGTGPGSQDEGEGGTSNPPQQS